ncbi:anthrone oxygenase family protein [Actinoplanes sp. NPDC051859]|uniref:anthrone oxygenase family protein n=1 Tax=Actinoplanes sp. NPDC051859 TaxID=3363909 RepID=UPI0037B6D4F8
MLTQTLQVAVLVGNGVVAGVLFAVALSTLPALIAMPPGRYIYAHKLLGRNWDPTMPILVLSTMALDLVLIAVAPQTTAPLFSTAAVLLVVVSVVSHFANVPINKQVRTLDPDHMPTDWADPRPLWRRWHLLRTACAVVALAVNATAIAVS